MKYYIIIITDIDSIFVHYRYFVTLIYMSAVNRLILLNQNQMVVMQV